MERRNDVCQKGGWHGMGSFTEIETGAVCSSFLLLPLDSRRARQTCSSSYLEEDLTINPKAMLPEKLSFMILCLGERGDP